MGVTERIQHEDDLQHGLDHAKGGQRGVPDASSVLEKWKNRIKISEKIQIKSARLPVVIQCKFFVFF